MTACMHAAPWLGGSCCDPDEHALDIEWEYGPTGEACLGLDEDGGLCPRRAEDKSVWCDLHEVLAADRLPTQPIPVVRIEVAA